MRENIPILLVEDDKAQAKVTQECLEKIGYDVICNDNGITAILGNYRDVLDKPEGGYPVLPGIVGSGQSPAHVSPESLRGCTQPAWGSQ